MKIVINDFKWFWLSENWFSCFLCDFSYMKFNSDVLEVNELNEKWFQVKCSSIIGKSLTQEISLVESSVNGDGADYHNSPPT